MAGEGFMNEELSLLVIGDEDNSIYTAIKDILSEYPKFTLVSTSRVIQQLEDGEHIDIALVLNRQEAPVIEVIQKIKRTSPETLVMFLNSIQDFQLVREVLRAGALDYLVIPDEINLLSERLQTLKEMTKTNKASGAVNSSIFSRGRGEVLAFYSGKGGSGTTFISSAFAQTLKLDSTAEVILLDLNLQYGGIETYLGIETNRSLADLKPVIQEINDSHIRNVTEKEKFSRLEVLLSPRDTEVAESIDEDYVQRLIRACKRSFDFVIIDIPSYIDIASFAAIEEADKIFYVITPDTPSIRVFKSVEELFKRLGIHLDERMEIIINKTGKDSELNGKDLSRFIQYPIAAEIKKDIKGVLHSINKGEPIRKEAKEKRLPAVAKDVQKWVAGLLK